MFSPVPLAIAILVAAILALFTWYPANAHNAPSSIKKPQGWKYPWSCCADKDCKMLSSKDVEERPQGYVISMTGEVVGYTDKRVKDSPDGEYHWCANPSGLDAGHTICLFVPPKGF